MQIQISNPEPIGVGEAGHLVSFSCAVSGFAKEESPCRSVREAWENRGCAQASGVLPTAQASGGSVGAMDTCG